MDKNKIIRYIAYSLEISVLFLLQETPGFMPSVFGARPVLILSAVMAISMFESELASMGFGIYAGVLLDFGLGCTMGFHALTLAVLCFFVSVFCRVVIQINFITSTLTAICSIAMAVLIGWFFLYLVAGYSMPSFALVNVYLPKYIYTVIVFPLIFVMNRGLSRTIRASDS